MKRPGITSFVLALFFLALGIPFAGAQSLEVMPGTERIFADIQWLKPFDVEKKWTLFSRARATVDYDNNTDLLTGAYINYTTKVGLGATLVGRISSRGGGGELGAHYFRATRTFMVYALTSIELAEDPFVAWFSIMRFTPALSEKWRMYSSLELYSNFDRDGHIASVQRIRLGLSRNQYQFGLALNLSGYGPSYDRTDSNPGIFLRREF